MGLNAITSLKCSGFICALLWSGRMMWRIGSFDLYAIVIIAIGGVVLGVCWYLAMGFVAERRRARDGEADVAARRGKLYPWIVWAALMTLTGIVTAGVLDLVDPLIPDGDWHWLIAVRHRGLAGADVVAAPIHQAGSAGLIGVEYPGSGSRLHDALPC